ncbi:MAG: STAS domain-containing protein [Bacteroidales bacterium]|nr:STAS domain-containing protein [Bacteroidales bacterium]
MLETRNINDILVVKFKDTIRLNALITEPVKESLLEFFNKPNVNLIFDLQGITFIDSSGFGVFLSALKAANNNYGQFKICNVDKDVMELFKLLQLHHVFEIYDKLDSCLASFNQ